MVNICSRTLRARGYVMIQRTRHLSRVRYLLRHFPVVAIVGARQVGKTTLAHQVEAQWDGPTHFFDLEDPADAARLAEPGLALRGLRGLIILDEVQLEPELFSVLRVLADRAPPSTRFLLLGSAALTFQQRSSETLAGRIAYHPLSGFSLAEVGADNLERLWVRGGLPRSYLSESETLSVEWRRQYVATFLDRDLRKVGINIPAQTMRRFWTMLAHYHGQTWNGSEFARSFGVSDTTVRRYLDLLSGAFVVQQLSPWFENLRKRQVRSPKVYLSDTGALHTLLGLSSPDALEGHPKVGASWEGFAIAQMLDILGARDEETYFWATHTGAELDLLIVHDGKKVGFEIKRTERPRVTRSMRSALADLHLFRLYVIHAGTDSFPLAENVDAIALSRCLEDLEPLEAGWFVTNERESGR